MSGSITQPAKADSALRNRAGRQQLVGKTLNEALAAAKGYPVDVIYGPKERRCKRAAGHVVLFVNDRNMVTGTF